MKKPPLNVLIGFIFALVATFQPIVIVNSDKVTLPSSPSWGLLVWASVAVLLGLYGRRPREYIGPALLLALNPVGTKIVLENFVLPELHVSNLGVSFSIGAFLAWIASAFILSAVFNKDNTSSDNLNVDKINIDNPQLRSSEDTQKASQNSGLNKTAVFVTLIICICIFGGIFIFSQQKNEVPKNISGIGPTTLLPVKGENKNTSENTTAKIIDNGLALSGLQNAEGGRASADYYSKYLTEQITCQMIAGTIRYAAEKIDISPVKNTNYYNNVQYESPSNNIPGFKRAIELAANYYRRSVRNKLSLSSAGIDPAVVSYVEKLTLFDQETLELYNEYAQTLKSTSKQIERIGDARDAHVSQYESELIANFENKFGIKLQTRQQLKEIVVKAATDEAAKFLEKKTPQELSANLIGSVFKNLDGSFSEWRVNAGEYVFGRITQSGSAPGSAFVDLEVQLKGSSTGNPGLIHARIIYVKDPDRNLFWPVAILDLSRR